MPAKKKQRMRFTALPATALLLLALAGRAGAEARLPGNLVWLAEIDPTIRQEMRYATARNFTGKPVPGYQAGECILIRPAALALARVQKRVAQEGYALKVYDCYRPETAVRSFMGWVASESATDGDPSYYPNVARRALVAQGYIASRSGHSTGTAIDLTLVPLAAAAPDASTASEVAPCTAPAAERAADDSIDMGTGYDCFDPRSHTDSDAISDEQRKARRTLAAAMGAEGFKNYEKEWWHFSFGAGGPSYDVPVTARPSAPAD